MQGLSEADQIVSADLVGVEELVHDGVVEGVLEAQTLEACPESEALQICEVDVLVEVVGSRLDDAEDVFGEEDGEEVRAGVLLHGAEEDQSSRLDRFGDFLHEEVLVVHVLDDFEGGHDVVLALMAACVVRLCGSSRATERAIHVREAVSHFGVAQPVLAREVDAEC